MLTPKVNERKNSHAIYPQLTGNTFLKIYVKQLIQIVGKNIHGRL